ncbi:MAG: T9SS type A sorting domain-containing protein [Bacteroidetes bacterium]|nr:T9SS type A sorting domain-containing protein [Bacteroidota bacterium]
MAANDNFGSSVATYSNKLIVGSPNQANLSAVRTGAVHVYKGENGNWGTPTALYPPAGVPAGAQFGKSVAVNRNWALVGTPNDNKKVAGSGSAFVYQYDSLTNSWTYKTNINSFNNGSSGANNLGYAVAMNGNYAFIGVPLDDTLQTTNSNNNTGLVLVYKITGNSWTLVSRLTTPAGTVTNENFGWSIACTETELFINAPLAQGNKGVVYRYVLNNGNWLYAGTIMGSVQIGYFGRGGIAVERRLLAVTNCYLSGSATYTGGADIYQDTNGRGAWVWTGKVTPPGAPGFTYLGYNGNLTQTGSVAVSGDMVLLGHPNYSSAKGSVYAFRKQSDQWTLDNTWVASDGKNGDQFGISLAMNGNYAVAGANNTTDKGASSGSVYYFRSPDIVASDRVADGYIDVAWRVSTNGALTNPPSAVYLQVFDSTNQKEVYKQVYDDISGSPILEGNLRHWVKPNTQNKYQLKLIKYGSGKILGNVYSDTGSTLAYLPPYFVSSTPTTSYPESVYLQFNSNSTYHSKLQLYRDGKKIAILDTSEKFYTDKVLIDNAGSIKNGQTYTYCLEGINETTKEKTTQACGTGGTIPINFQASDKQYPNKVQLSWNNMANFAQYLVIERDGTRLTSMLGDKTSYEDVNAIPGFNHVYKLTLDNGNDGKFSQRDSGSISANGTIRGMVTNKTGGFGVKGVKISLNGFANGDTVSMTTLTDNTGSYAFTSIYYYTQSTFTLTASYSGANFTENGLQTTLKISNPNAVVNFESDITIKDLPPGKFNISAFDVKASSTDDQADVSVSYTCSDTVQFIIKRDKAVIGSYVVYPGLTSPFTTADAGGIPGQFYTYSLDAYYITKTGYYRSTLYDTLSYPRVLPLSAGNVVIVANTNNANIYISWSHSSRNNGGVAVYRNGTRIGDYKGAGDGYFFDYSGSNGKTMNYSLRSFIIASDGNRYESNPVSKPSINYPQLKAISNGLIQPTTENYMQLSWTYPFDFRTYNFSGVKIVRYTGAQVDTIATLTNSAPTIFTDRNFDFTNAGLYYKVFTYKNPNSLDTGTKLMYGAALTLPTPSSLTATTNLEGTIMAAWTYPTRTQIDGFRVISNTSPKPDTAWKAANEMQNWLALPSTYTNASINIRVAAYRLVNGKFLLSNNASANGASASFSGGNMPAVTHFVATKNLPDKVTLTWEYPSYYLPDFKIYRDNVLIGTVSGDARLYNDLGVTDALSHLYRIQPTLTNPADKGRMSSTHGRRAYSARVQGIASNINNGAGVIGAQVDLFERFLYSAPSTYAYRKFASTQTDSSGFYEFTDLNLFNKDSIGVGIYSPGHLFNPGFKGFKSSVEEKNYVVNFEDTVMPAASSGKTISKPIAFRATANPLLQSVELHWNTNGPNFTGFKVYRGLELLQTIAGSQSRIYIDKGGAPGIVYTYRVKCYWEDEPGHFVESEYALAYAATPELAPVTNMASTPFNDYLQLSWNHANDLHTYYEIKRNGKLMDFVATGVGMTWNDTTGVQGINYTYQITSVLVKTDGIYRSTATTLTATYPMIPMVSSLTAGLDSNTVVLSWNPGSNYADYFNIYRDGVRIGSTKAIRSTGLKNKYLDTTGKPFTSYRYEVRQGYKRGAGVYEGKTSFADQVFPALAGAHNVSVSSLTGQDKVRITWKYNYKAGTGFKVYRRINGSGTLENLTPSALGRYTFTFEDITGIPGSNYVYYVEAQDIRLNTPIAFRQVASALVNFPSISNPYATGGGISDQNVLSAYWSHNSTDPALSFEIREDSSYLFWQWNVNCSNPAGSCLYTINAQSSRSVTYPAIPGTMRNWTKLNHTASNRTYSQGGFHCCNGYCCNYPGTVSYTDYFYIRAVKNVGGINYYSSWISITLNPYTPPRLSNSEISAFSASKGTFDNKVLITWTFTGYVAGVKSFKIFRDNNLLESVDANQTDYNDQDPVPGKKHIYSIHVEYQSGGTNTGRIGKSDYGWSIPNGEITGAVVTSQGNNGVPGVTLEASTVVEGNTYRYTTTTDAEGKYEFTGLYYGKSSTYTVKATMAGHQFVKNSQTTSLDYTVNRAVLPDFLDQTAYVITGIVKRTDACPLDSVKVKMITRYKNNSTAKTDEVYTTSSGRYSFNIDPNDPNLQSITVTVSDTQTITSGSTSRTSYYKFNGVQKTGKVYSWTTFTSFPFVTNQDINDNMLYAVNLIVRSTCGSLGNYRFKVDVIADNGCFRKTYVTQLNGRLPLQYLPPYSYKIVVSGVTPSNANSNVFVDYLSVRPISLDLEEIHNNGGAQKVILGTMPSTDVDMIYHKLPQIAIGGVGTYLCDDPNNPILWKQNDSLFLTMRVTENHAGNQCDVDNGFLVVKNSGAQKELDTVWLNPLTKRFNDYRFRVGDPFNVAPFTKPLIIEYHTESDGFLAELIKPVIIDGTVAQQGSDVIVTAGDKNQFQMPLMVLRDPPGDQSYSYIEAGTTLTRTLNISDKNSGYGGIKSENEFEIFGIGAAFDTEFKAAGGTGNEASFEVSVTTKTRIQTPDDNSVINADNTNFLLGNAGDVIVGAGIALKYGINERIAVDNANCKITKSSIVSISPEKINTTWVYTVDQIRKLIQDYRNDSSNVDSDRYIIEGKTKDQTKQDLHALIRNWESVLKYHLVDNVPYIALCNTSNYDKLPEPFKSQAKEYARNGYCKSIGTYTTEMPGGKEVFKPNREIKWTSDLMDKYNKVGKIIRDLSSDDWQLKFRDGLIYSDGVLNNVNLNDGYKEMYGLDAENITFSGNTNFEKSVTVAKSESRSYNQFWSIDWDNFAGVTYDQEFNVITLAGFGVYAGFLKTIAGIKGRTGAIFGYNHEFERSRGNEKVEENTTGYVLTDNDAGDQFSVSVFRGNDPMQTPFFELLGGRSSCPPEPGTIYRDQPQITLEDVDGNFYNPVQRDLDPNKPFVLPLKLSNKAPEIFNEEHYFTFSQVQNYNNYGAKLVNQGVILGATEFRIPSGGSTYTFLEITRPTNYYDLPDIQVSMAASCPNLAAPDNYTADDQPLEMYFRHPCSEVTILSPQNEWVIKKASNLRGTDTAEALVIKMGDYDVENPLLESITLQYSRIGSGSNNPWKDIATIKRDVLKQYFLENKLTYKTPIYPFTWNIRGNASIIDGEYEIRAKANCGSSGFTLSPSIKGTINRSSVNMVGVPEPADGILSLGDNISVTFSNEILPDTFSMKYKFVNANDTTQVIPATVTISGKLLTFTLTPGLAALDGTMVRAMLDGVKDLNENAQDAPIIWEFLVVNNPLYWNPRVLNLEVYAGSKPTINVDLVNTKDGPYTANLSMVKVSNISNLSGASSVTVPARGKVTVGLVVDATTRNPGVYSDTAIAAVTTGGFKPLKIPVRVTVLPRPVYWNVDPAKFPSNSTIVCNYMLDSNGILSKDTLDKIAAFIDGEIRGVANIVKTGNYYCAYLNVAGYTADNGKKIKFYVWNAKTGTEYAANPRGTITFLANDWKGTTPDPRVFDVKTSQDSVRYIPLKAGWNYLALNTTQKDMSVSNILAGLRASDGDVIRTQDASAHYNAGTGQWVALSGGINNISTDDGYMLFLNRTDTMKVSGKAAELNNVQLNSGWNLIGNPYQGNQPINAAFKDAGISHRAKIKNDVQAAEYDSASKTWSGFTSLQVNKSYMLKNSKIGLLTYRRGLDLNCSALQPTAHENNMTFLASVKLNGNEVNNGDVYVRAFVKDECRGTGRLEFVPATNRYMLNLFVYTDTGDKFVQFKIYDAGNNIWYNVPDSLPVKTDWIYGKPAVPYMFSNQRDVTGVNTPGSKAIALRVMPNPSSSDFKVEFHTAQAGPMQIALYDEIGKCILNQKVQAKAGLNEFRIQSARLGISHGLYFLRVGNDQSQSTLKLMKTD